MNKRDKVFMIIFAVLLVIGIYAIVRVIIDPNWYFGKSLVPENVTMEEFWDYIRSAL